MMQSLFSKDMMKKVFCQGYLWLLLLLLYSPIFIIIIFSFTEAKVMGNWTGFSLQLYKNLFEEGTHHSLTAALVNTVTIALITATVSTLFGTLTAIGIYNLRNRYARNAIQFVNNIPILIVMASMKPEIIPGNISGMMTLRSACIGEAPRSSAAS